MVLCAPLATPDNFDWHFRIWFFTHHDRLNCNQNKAPVMLRLLDGIWKKWQTQRLQLFLWTGDCLKFASPPVLNLRFKETRIIFLCSRIYSELTRKLLQQVNCYYLHHASICMPDRCASPWWGTWVRAGAFLILIDKSRLKQKTNILITLHKSHGVPFSSARFQ